MLTKSAGPGSSNSQNNPWICRGFAQTMINASSKLPPMPHAARHKSSIVERIDTLVNSDRPDGRVLDDE